MRHKYKFTDKHNTLGGKVASMLGILAAALVIYGLYISFKAKGNGGTTVGIFGTLAFLCSTVGLLIGLSSFKEEDKFYFLSWLGTIICGIVWISICGMIAIGI